MTKVSVVITSIAGDQHPVLRQYAAESAQRDIGFVVIGDTKSPMDFHLPACDFYSIDQQKQLGYTITDLLPTKHYARKNVGYLVAIAKGADVLIETDDDNIPLASFWEPRQRLQPARVVVDAGWTNVYGYYSGTRIWPRGFALDQILKPLPGLSDVQVVNCPVQQGLADDNPDVDAVYRLTQTLPFQFNRFDNVGLQTSSICPFNSQNTTWFSEAFPLLYLPSYCSFRMTDIWRSFVAQRLLWTCDWTLLFHNSTVRQERNDHNLMLDFEDEISGYVNNHQIVEVLKSLNLGSGPERLAENLYLCYEALVAKAFIDKRELALVSAWIKDLATLAAGRTR